MHAMHVFNAFAPSGRSFTYASIPMALPWAMRSLGFQPANYHNGISFQISDEQFLFRIYIACGLQIRTNEEENYHNGISFQISDETSSYIVILLSPRASANPLFNI